MRLRNQWENQWILTVMRMTNRNGWFLSKWNMIEYEFLIRAAPRYFLFKSNVVIILLNRLGKFKSDYYIEGQRELNSFRMCNVDPLVACVAARSAQKLRMSICKNIYNNLSWENGFFWNEDKVDLLFNYNFRGLWIPFCIAHSEDDQKIQKVFKDLEWIFCGQSTSKKEFSFKPTFHLS